MFNRGVSMSNQFVFMVAVALLSATSAAAFTVEFSDYSDGEALSEKGASGGAWAEMPEAAVNVPIGQVNAIAINHEATGPLTFDLDAGIPANRTSCDIRIASETFADVAQLEVEAGACRVTLARRDDGRTAFALAAGEAWHLLAGGDIEPKLDVLYELRLETVSLAEGTYASLLVKGLDGYVRLADGYGATWFALNSDKETFSQIEFSGNGSVSDFSGADSGKEPIPAIAWVGGATGDWNVTTNWVSAPASGDVVRVDGPVELTRDKERATVRGLVGRLGADGALELLAGTFETPIAFDCGRPRVGKALTVEAGSFAGLSRPFESVTWYRGTSTKAYAAGPIAETASYKPVADDYEHWLRVIARRDGAVAFEREFYFSTLPVLYLTTNDGQTPTPEKEPHKGWVTVQGNEEFKAGYDGKMEIKVRGNTTSTLPKKPWKLKLDKKAEMCGIAKSKHWVLLANYLDESAMRNKLAYDFANEIGSLGMKSDWVECVLNGEWQGLYQLCEHIRIDENRVNVFNWEDEAEERGIDGGDKDLSWVTEQDDISGGYLFESSDEYDELSKFMIRSGNLRLPVMVNSPEYLCTNSRMMDWCEAFMQGFADATTSADGYSKDGLHYSEYADVDSMAAYFLVVEMFGNFDAEKKSRYFYKDRGELMKFGPVWDFDWGVGNYMIGDNPRCWRAQNHVESFFREWADDPWFCTRLRTLYWSVAREKFAAILGEKGLLAKHRDKLALAAAANDTKWRLNHGFDADVAILENYLVTHLDWMDEKFADVPTLMASLKAASSDHPSTSPYTRDGSTLPIAFANLPDSGRLASGKPLRLSMSVGAGVAKVGVYANGRKVGDPVTVSGGRIEVTIPARALTAAKGEANSVSLVAYDASGAVVARNFATLTVSPPLTILFK